MLNYGLSLFNFVKIFSFWCHQLHPILVNQFGLLLDDQQVVCCKGWLNNLSLHLQSKNSAILSHQYRIVELLVLWAHQNVKHGGVLDTLLYLQEKYWILKGQQVVRKIIRSCVVCRKLEDSSYPSVPAPDLPFEGFQTIHHLLILNWILLDSRLHMKMMDRNEDYFRETECMACSHIKRRLKG